MGLKNLMITLTMFFVISHGSQLAVQVHFKNSVTQAKEEHLKVLRIVRSIVSYDELLRVRLGVCEELMVEVSENLEDIVEMLEVLGNSWNGSDVEWFREQLTIVVINHETCFDGFEELSYQRSLEILNTLRDSMKRERELVNRSLAMVTRIKKKELSKQGLLTVQDTVNLPQWFGSQDQKLLFTCSPTPNATVAVDGTGDFKTITEAVNSVPPRSNSRFFIHVKVGLYRENVVVSKDKPNVYMYGDGSTKTIVSGSLSRFEKPGFTTFQTATFSVLARGFVVKDMRFVNIAGPEKKQAVAFHSKSTESVMYRCSFMGYQDTLYAHAGKQFYRECDIVGTVDFIFGYASVVFQKCNIRPRIPLPHQY